MQSLIFGNDAVIMSGQCPRIDKGHSPIKPHSPLRLADREEDDEGELKAIGS
jgi:hypothetical protein